MTEGVFCSFFNIFRYGEGNPKEEKKISISFFFTLILFF